MAHDARSLDQRSAADVTLSIYISFSSEGYARCLLPVSAVVHRMPSGIYVVFTSKSAALLSV
jgi:hypothetical protein